MGKRHYSLSKPRSMDETPPWKGGTRAIDAKRLIQTVQVYMRPDPTLPWGAIQTSRTVDTCPFSPQRGLQAIAARAPKSAAHRTASLLGGEISAHVRWLSSR
ncbi:MAG: hypothetical protein QOJ64_92 [Acidobacteriota bacterium]|jgi:hypothetical protein|nr:hypothetical protein [Acidobacteriota bacterium]